MFRHLCYKYKDFVWILDDGSYFTQTNSEIDGNDDFYPSNVDLTPKIVKYKTKGKFEDKLLVYAILSPFGISRPYVTPSSLVINEVNYTDICLAKKNSALHSKCTRKQSIDILARTSEMCNRIDYLID